MTVKELKQALHNQPDSLPVYIQLPETIFPGSTLDTWRETAAAIYRRESPISSEYLEIVAGKSFDW